ncbi:MAG: DUF6348 family protein [Ruminococcus sp.]|nr:DUF6348 family protein [Ruminococcus sp.]
MAFFKKKIQQEEPEVAKDPKIETKKALLDALNSKLNGTVYDDCIIMPKGFTVDINIAKQVYVDSEDLHMLSVVFLVKHDEFDEPLIEPVDAQGRKIEDAVQMAVDMFYGAVWHPLDQSMTKKNPVHISVDYLRQHYDFDMYCQSVVRIGMADKTASRLIDTIKADIPKYLGSKKYYWLRIYLAKYQDKQVVEVRINGSICTELSKRFQLYVDSWNAESAFLSEKQYAIFVQHEDDQCPFEKEIVIDAGHKVIDMMQKIENHDQYLEMAKTIDAEIAAKLSEKISDSKLTETIARGLSAETRIFISEILAKLTLGYTEGDSLFLLDDEQSVEFKKTQMRSYFYLQQVVIEFLSTRPEQENVSRIVTNSVAFREMRKVFDQAKEQGKEIQPGDLFVPGTSFKIALDGYKVW